MSHCVPQSHSHSLTQVRKLRYGVVNTMPHSATSNAVETRYEPRTAESGLYSVHETKVLAPFSPNVKRTGKACVTQAVPHMQVLSASASFSCPSPAMSPGRCLKCPFPSSPILPLRKTILSASHICMLRHCWPSRMCLLAPPPPPGSPSIAFNYL